MQVRRVTWSDAFASSSLTTSWGIANRRLARIKTEQIIRDDYMIETLEIMEVYFNLLVSRFGLIEANKYA